MIKTDIKIETKHLIGAVLVCGAIYAAYRIKKGLPEIDNFNPASDKNYVYQGVKSAVGQENITTAADYYFGAWDLINPFNESDKYALEVFGFGKKN